MPLRALAVAGLWVAAAFGAESGSGKTVTVDLESADVPYAIGSFRVPLGAAAAFRKEPDFAGHEVYRKVIEFGTDANSYVGFACDLTASKLHLDMNLNRDLSDDPERAFAPVPQDLQWGAATVSNLTLTFKTTAGMRRLLGDFTFYPRKDASSAFVNHRSYLQGKAVLAGQEWQVGVVGGHDPEKPVYLLARPWSQRDRPFTTYGTPDLVGFSERVFLGGHAYGVRGQPVSRDGVAGYRLEFTEQQVKLGELRVSGKHVHRLILVDDKGYTAAIDQPGPAAKLPVGTYGLTRVWLRADKEAVRASRKTISVKDSGTINLTLGGPLRGTVDISRQRGELRLEHNWVGVDGGAYRVMQHGSPEAPKVRIQFGGKEVASGQFSFG